MNAELGRRRLKASEKEKRKNISSSLRHYKAGPCNPSPVICIYVLAIMFIYFAEA
jgi:hypothetical protein